MYKGQTKGYAKKVKIKPLAPKYYETGEKITWDGTNEDEVVRFCYEHDNSLSSIHNVSGDKTLTIEPADVLRAYCVRIALGETVHAYKRLDCNWVAVKKGE